MCMLITKIYLITYFFFVGLNSSVGIATGYGLDGRPFPGVKWPGRGADHPPPPSAEVENE
jgi:hypothetical protein